jgi:Tol biopolymer transport system component
MTLSSAFTKVMGSTIRPCATAVALLASLACNTDTSPVLGAPGITIVSGADVTDTVLAVLRDPLVIEVRDVNGRVAPNVEVQLTSGVPQAAPPLPWVAMSDADSVPNWFVLSLRTNAKGRVSVAMRIMPVAGVAAIEIRVPELGLLDTARVVGRPGAPARVRILPRDSVVALGSTLQLRGGTTDAHGNVTSPAASVTADAGLSIDGAFTMTGTGYGLHTVVMRTGSWADTTTVTVVPRGRFAAMASYQAKQFWVQNLDGTAARLYDGAGAGRAYSPGPTWSPDGRQIVYAQGADQQQRLYLQPLDGTARRLIATPPPELLEEIWPAWSHDGRWVYFSGRTPTRNYSLWRASADGATVEALNAPVQEDTQVQASPSPDGHRVAYIGNKGIRIYDIAIGTTANIGVAADAVQWSPDGRRLAFIGDSGSGIVNTDGTNLKRISPGSGFADLGIDWSPDNEWLIYRGPGYLELYQLSTELRIEIPYTFGFTSARWAPQ